MNILLIDDDRLTLKAIRRVLSEKGFRVFPASNKLNALTWIRSESIDCVVCDVQLPDSTLTDMVTAVKEAIGREIPLILISSAPENPEIDDTLLTAADAFVPKPINFPLLIRVIERLCNNSLVNPH